MPSGRVVLAVVLLALVCTAAAFLLLVALVGEIGPVRATTITYVNPAVAVVAGALVLNEQVTVWTLGGFAAGDRRLGAGQPAPARAAGPRRERALPGSRHRNHLTPRPT